MERIFSLIVKTILQALSSGKKPKPEPKPEEKAPEEVAPEPEPEPAPAPAAEEQKALDKVMKFFG